MKLFCRHNNVKLIRAHKNSLLGEAYRKHIAYVDVFDCVVVAACTDCEKLLNAKTDERMYAEKIFNTCECCNGTGKIAAN